MKPILKSYMADYEITMITDEARQTYQKALQDYRAYRNDADEVFSYVDQGKKDQAVQVIRDGGSVVQALDESMNALITSKENLAKDYYDQSDSLFAQSRNLVIGLTIFSILIGLGVAFFISRSISSAARQMVSVADGISAGDLDQRILVRSRDELGDIATSLGRMIGYLQNMAGIAQKLAQGDLTQNVTPMSTKDVLGNAFKGMVDSLRDVVRDVANSASSLSIASGELASAANQAGQATGQISTTIQQVAKGTAQQSESVTRTATSVEQMSRAIDGVARGAQDQTQAVSKAASVTSQIASAIQQVAASADAGAKGSEQAAEVAQGGTKTVSATIQGMEKIQAKVNLSAQKVQEMGARSEQIGVIVETIDDIAAQTNLLALNAAIEAARAGEHGKGFAVVADEVRKLAERSALATKEIAGLIKNIQGTVNEAVTAMHDGSVEVERGVQQANQAGKALDEILNAAKEVNQQVAQIATASKRMSGLSNELIAATDAVSAVVEENTAATEEMAANSSEVTQSIENIASVSEENSAAVEEVSASAEEMNAQVEEVTASAQGLAEMAEALRQVIGEFKLVAEPQSPKDESQIVKPVLHQASVSHSAQGSNGHSPAKVF